eukprot:m51a1_g2388 hypothetical protein (102) ;mRNA; r:719221-725303
MATTEDPGRQTRARTTEEPQGEDEGLLSIVPDDCLVWSLMPLLGPWDLCSLSRTCRRMRRLCTAAPLWPSVTVESSARLCCSPGPHVLQVKGMIMSTTKDP